MRGEARQPRLGYGAAILRDGRLLLVQRRRDPGAGHWGLRAGTVPMVHMAGSSACPRAGRALNAEMDHHLASEGGAGNSRNAYGCKRVVTDTGRIALEIPRDRQGSGLRKPEMR